MRDTVSVLLLPPETSVRLGTLPGVLVVSFSAVLRLRKTLARSVAAFWSLSGWSTSRAVL
jgi:hypothetical protein